METSSMLPTKWQLLNAIAGEHRLRREGQREEREAERWERRVAYAEVKGLPDLAAAARERAMHHKAAATSLSAEAEQRRREIERLKGLLGWCSSPPLA